MDMKSLWLISKYSCDTFETSVKEYKLNGVYSNYFTAKVINLIYFWKNSCIIIELKLNFYSNATRNLYIQSKTLP